MTLEKIKKIFRFGWIAKNETGCWHWFSKEPELFLNDDFGYYWSGEDEIKIGFLENTEDLSSVDSLIEVDGK